MEIIYNQRPSILAELGRGLHLAHKHGRLVEKVVFTEVEYLELKRELNLPFPDSVYQQYTPYRQTIFGVKFEVKG